MTPSRMWFVSPASAALAAFIGTSVSLAASVQAQEVVAGRPPMYSRLERARVYLSPLTPVRLRIDNGSSKNGAEYSSHEIGGIGLSLGADGIVHRHVALWINGHVGTMTGARAASQVESASLSRVQGSYGALGAGVAGVLSTGKWTGLLGIGLFAAGAEWEGRLRETREDTDFRATLTGIVSTMRSDYTLRNGFFIGFGVDAGGGIASGSATEGGNSPVGDWVALYIPMGWTY